MLRATLERAESIVPREQILVVVARQHRRWWERELEDLPRSNILVQPHNRGTATGILYPLLEILARDPGAVLISFPSDHYVGGYAKQTPSSLPADPALSDTIPIELIRSSR